MGMILSIGIIFISFYFDTTIKDEEEIEKITNLPVIGVVPVSSRIKILKKKKRKILFYQLQNLNKNKETELKVMIC